MYNGLFMKIAVFFANAFKFQDLISENQLRGKFNYVLRVKILFKIKKFMRKNILKYSR
jgi:hypothetical protein